MALLYPIEYVRVPGIHEEQDTNIYVGSKVTDGQDAIVTGIFLYENGKVKVSIDRDQFMRRAEDLFAYCAEDCYLCTTRILLTGKHENDIYMHPGDTLYDDISRTKVKIVRIKSGGLLWVDNPMRKGERTIYEVTIPCEDGCDRCAQNDLYCAKYFDKLSIQ